MGLDHDPIAHPHQTLIDLILQKSDPRITEGSDDLDAVVGGGIVNEDEFPVLEGLGEDAVDGLSDVGLTPVDGHADGHLGGRQGHGGHDTGGGPTL